MQERETGLRQNEVRFRNLVISLAFASAVWGWVDIAQRGRVVEGRPELHRTDFSVYTTAGAAFFDGRDPYTVTNPRGWSYLYPPLFALMVAPLSGLGPVAQVLVWFSLSLACCLGVYVESCRVWRLCVPNGGVSPSLTRWVALCAGLTVLWPTLECLQRGQVGVELLYALMIGLRLVLEGRTFGAVCLGGIVLAWPVSVKLIPALPVGVLLWQSGALALGPRRRRGDAGRAAAAGLGVMAGGALFLLLIPSIFLGWGPNLRHLETWTRKVVTNPDAGDEAKFHIDSLSNQSLKNAAHRLATTLRGRLDDDPEAQLLKFAKNELEVRWAIDRAFAERRKADASTRVLVLAAQGLFAVVLFALGTFPRRDDTAGQTAVFGLACVATLLLSPVAWTHYFMTMIPAVFAVPLCLHRAGRPTAARASAVVPAALVWAHYLAKPWVGPLGLLGLGTAAWFAVVGVLMLRERFHGRVGRAFAGPKFSPLCRAPRKPGHVPHGEVARLVQSEHHSG